jgi:hypothetical protein
MAGRVFPQASVFGLSEPVNLSEPLHAFAGGPDINGPMQPNKWQQYLKPVGQLRPSLEPQPKLIEVAVTDNLQDLSCDEPWPSVYVNLGRPFVCREIEVGPNRTVQDYYMVMRIRVDQAITDVTARSGAKAGWLAATVAVAVVYSQYLRLFYWPVVGWPNSTAMDYCLAGISARAVYPAGGLVGAEVNEALAATDDVLDVLPSTRFSRTGFFMQGFRNGQLIDCAEM